MQDNMYRDHNHEYQCSPFMKSNKKCLKGTKKLPRASYPLGNTSQFSKPVLHKTIKRIKEITLTIQSFEDLPLDMHYPSTNSVICGG